MLCALLLTLSFLVMLIAQGLNIAAQAGHKHIRMPNDLTSADFADKILRCKTSSAELSAG